jgi:short subunit dehydrogenase-like uncharacterized protein
MQLLAICVGQAALTIVHDFDRLPARAGVLTPAAALGRPLGFEEVLIQAW